MAKSSFSIVVVVLNSTYCEILSTCYRPLYSFINIRNYYCYVNCCSALISIQVPFPNTLHHHKCFQNNFKNPFRILIMKPFDSKALKDMRLFANFRMYQTSFNTLVEPSYKIGCQLGRQPFFRIKQPFFL